jgi:S1-C subfamily serine protease
MNFSPRSRDRKTLFVGASAGAVAIFCAFGVLAQTAPSGPVNAPTAVAPVAAVGMPSFADIVEKVAPAVVSIDVQKKAARSATPCHLACARRARTMTKKRRPRAADRPAQARDSSSRATAISSPTIT